MEGSFYAVGDIKIQSLTGGKVVHVDLMPLDMFHRLDAALVAVFPVRFKD